jgi:hypothetical protein
MPFRAKSLFFLFSFVIILIYRIVYTSNSLLINQCLTWDALGYYFYLPGLFIYDDIKDFTWLPKIFEQYQLPGNLYQVRTMPDGSHSGYYGIGVSILQMPFFLLGHLYAKLNGHLTDGWSTPYQWSIAIASMFYGLTGLWLQWKFLSKYFNTKIVLMTLCIILLGTNFLQYVAIDGGHVHVYGYFILSLILYGTQRYFDTYATKYIIVVGVGIGLAALIRPTDAIIFLVPLFWTRGIYQKIKEYKGHFLLVLFLSIALYSLQLFYWKMSSGIWWNPPGSKWQFITPNLQVLFGGAKGWVIYTPICILFFAGLFVKHHYEWRKSILIFTILNLWIICAWYDWRYGGSYGCRALVQGMAVMSPLIAIVLERVVHQRFRYLFYSICIYFIVNNLFQIAQYNKGIIKAEGMSWKEYGKVYWRMNT